MILTTPSCSSNNADAVVFCQSKSPSINIINSYCMTANVTSSSCTEGEVRLVGGTTQYEGTVEVCVNRAWGSVCSYSGWYNASRIVCAQMGALPIGQFNMIDC